MAKTTPKTPSATKVKKTPHVAGAIKIRKPSLRRLGRRGGAKRLARGMYDYLREMIYAKLHYSISNTMKFTRHAKHHTVTIKDVTNALKFEGRSLFGVVAHQKKAKKALPEASSSSAPSSAVLASA